MKGAVRLPEIRLGLAIATEPYAALETITSP